MVGGSTTGQLSVLPNPITANPPSLCTSSLPLCQTEAGSRERVQHKARSVANGSRM